jgi:hypothetical protein
VKNGISISSLKYASNFDHSALVAGLARTYSQRGIRVKSEPALPGGKHADLAVGMGKNWVYIEVKTRSNGAATERHRPSLRQDLLREILRLRAHSLKQLPKKQSSLMVLATSASPTRRKAVSKITIMRSFGERIFAHDSGRVLGLLVFVPFRSEAHKRWKYASAMIPNPIWEGDGENLEKLIGVQL